MTEAIFGLVGVIIGASISSVTTFFMERRKEGMAARVAARLVRDELYLVAVWIEDLIGSDSLPGDLIEHVRARTTADIWAEQRAHLAVVMQYRAFADAGLAANAAASFKYWLVTQPVAVQLDGQNKRFLKDLLDNLRPGLEALKEVAE